MASTGRLSERRESLGHAVKHATGPQCLLDSKSRNRILGADRFEAGNRKVDAFGPAPANEIVQNLRGGEVDRGDAGRFQHNETHSGQGMHCIENVPAEVVGVEKGQRRLESRDDDAGFRLARNMRTCRPPDRGAGNALEDQQTRARGAPHAMHQRQRDTDADTLLNWKQDDGRGGGYDEQEFDARLPVDRNDLSDMDDTECDEQQYAAERRLRHVLQKRRPRIRVT